MAEPGWFDRNRARAFPFLSRTIGTAVDGPVTVQNLPKDCIVDAGFIAGPASAFESDNHTIFLLRVRRESDVLYFDFAGTSSGLVDVTLTFTRDVNVARYVQEFADDTEMTTSISDSDSLSSQGCDEPLLSGFLVTGDLTALLELLPGDGSIGDNDAGESGVIEPTCVQNLSNAYVTGIAVANSDRMHAQAANNCDEIVYAYEEGAVFVQDVCIQGDVLFRSGYNAEVSQDISVNRIVLRAVVGGGEGSPCEEVPLYEDEAPPEGSLLLTGGPSCFELVRSINGSDGPRLNLQGGLGVIVQPDPETNTIIVNADFTGMVGCYSEDTAEDTEVV
jgi:hypothetical protein